MKKYKIVATKTFSREFKKIDRYTQILLLKFIKENLENTENPYKKGKPLKSNLSGLWRYRIMNYRLIAEIKDNTCIIKMLKIGYRKEIYKRI